MADVNTCFRRTNMTTEERRRPAVGTQIRRWRADRGMTLANVAERTGLNVGYLSQIENDKASPSLTCLASIGDALDVPMAWFFLENVPAPTVVRAAERSVTARDGLGRIERVDGGDTRDVVIVEGIAPAGGRAGMHAHAGDEHHLVLQGRWRMSQGDHVVDVGPGDYARGDGAITHDQEVIGDEEGNILIVTLRNRAGAQYRARRSVKPPRSRRYPSARPHVSPGGTAPSAA